MLMNLHTLQWDEDLCKIFNIPLNILPKIVPSSCQLGIINNGPFKGLSLTGCIGDQQAATLGQLCINQGDVKNTYGTGAFLIFNTGNRPISSKHGLLTTVLWQFDDQKEATYALEGSVAVAGQAVQFLRDNIGMITEAKECSDYASECKDDSGIYFVTAFSGLYSPYWRSDATGLIYGLTMHTQKKHICKAVLEATCFRTCEIIDAMKEDTKQFGIEFNSLNVDGGMSASDIMLEYQSNLLQINVIRPVMIETTALGAAIAAGLYVGFWSDLNEVKDCIGKKRKVFKPSITEKKAMLLRKGWKDAISRCFKNDKIIEEKQYESNINGSILVGVMMGILALSVYWRKKSNK
eukprot:133309_1